MVNESNILYSAAAVRRILGLSKSFSVKVREFANAVWVWVKGKRPTFMSKAVFKQHFVERRKQDSKSIRVQQRSSHLFVAFNPGKSTNYLLEARADGVFCTCDDFNNQLAFWSKGCCKHGYALLAYLGFMSLRDYLTAQTVVPLHRASEPAAVYAA